MAGRRTHYKNTITIYFLTSCSRTLNCFFVSFHVKTFQIHRALLYTSYSIIITCNRTREKNTNGGMRLVMIVFAAPRRWWQNLTGSMFECVGVNQFRIAQSITLLISRWVIGKFNTLKYFRHSSMFKVIDPTPSTLGYSINIFKSQSRSVLDQANGQEESKSRQTKTRFVSINHTFYSHRLFLVAEIEFPGCVFFSFEVDLFHVADRLKILLPKELT